MVGIAAVPGVSRTMVAWMEGLPQKGDCQNYGPFLGPYYNTGPNTGPNLRDPKRDHTFDNPPKGLGGVRDLKGLDAAIMVPFGATLNISGISVFGTPGVTTISISYHGW